MIKKTLFKILGKTSRIINSIQGKGWGTATIEKEFESACNFIQKKPKLIIDIGANKGLYSNAVLEKFPEVNLHMFEPSSTNYKILLETFGKNKNVIINQSAVSEGASTMELFYDHSGSGLASLTKRNLDHFNLNFNLSETVDVIKFEDYWTTVLNKKIIDFIKIDVEGHELNVLKGMGNALLNTKLIQFEFGGCNIDTKTYFQNFWYLFHSLDFAIFRITPIGIQEIESYSESEECFQTTNYLAFNKSLK